MKRFWRDRKGQSLIEVLIGLAIGAILIGAASLGVVFILRSSTATQYLQSGTQLNQDLVDRVRSVAGATWQDLHGLTKGTSTAYFVSASGTEQIVIEGKEGVLSNEIFDGLVGHWNFDEATSTATTTTFDTSGSGNHGTLTNSPTRATSTCKVSHCLSFDGTNDYVTNDSVNPWGSDFSIMMWVKPSRDSFDVFASRETFLTNGFRFGIQTTWKLVFWATQSGGTGSVASVDNALAQDTWRHAAATRSGTTVILYIDGTQAATGTVSIVTPSAGLQIGGGSIGEPTLSLIDDVRVYNRALSADEVERLWNSTVFTRYFNVENVSRDSNGDIVSSGGNDDPSTQKITSYVEWPGAAVAVGQVKIVDYVTRWANRVFNQSDWAGGLGQTGVITEPNNRFDNATSVSNPAGSIRIEGL